MIAFQQRACAILFNLLRAHRVEGPFLLPSNICPVVPLTFFKAGRSFEFVDIAPDTLCINHRQIVERWTAAGLPTPAGLIYVRTYGAVFDLGQLFSTIKKITPTALIVDDRCLCEPTFDEKLVSCADVALYSTGYAKVVDLGFGGVGVLRDGVPYQRSSLPFDRADLRSLTASYKHSLETRSAFSYVDCHWLDVATPDISWLDFRKLVNNELIRIRKLKVAINSVYSSRLPKIVQLSPEFQGWRFNIHVRDKASLLNAVQAAGFFASGHYDSLAGIFGVGQGHCARTFNNHIVNFFNDRYFSISQATKMVDMLIDLDLLHPSEFFYEKSSCSSV